MKENIGTTRLSNGLTILTDRMPGVRSVTLGFFCRIGARHEPAELNGISHFIEHCVFKGTAKRSAFEIAVETDRLGGHLDAFTMHEETGFAIKVVDSELAKAFDLLGDLLINPAFDEKELKREQKVIIEEIKMTEDAPEDFLGELYNEKLFPGHPLGLPIAGTPRSVRSFDRETTTRFHRAMFSPRNVIVAAAGNVAHDEIVELAAKYFGGASETSDFAAFPQPKVAAPILLKRNANLEQSHLLISTPFPNAVSDERYAADVLANALGGGTSSRLWQRIREEKGLAYSVGASAAMYQDCGVFTIYAASSPSNLPKVLRLALGELRAVARDGITENELGLMKAQSDAAILLGLEDSATRAATLARLEMMHGRQISIAETLEKMNAVTAEEVRAVAKSYFLTENVGFGALGNLNGLKIGRNALTI
jgi:predicted Zn-dependent peptidase